jgi:hypothetical protein
LQKDHFQEQNGKAYHREQDMNFAEGKDDHAYYKERFGYFW